MHQRTVRAEGEGNLADILRPASEDEEAEINK